MDELIDFLKHCLDDDERIARKAAGTVWEERAFHWHADGHEVRPQEIEHITRHEPNAALADIAAKRKILELLAIAEQHLDKVRRTAPEYRLVAFAEAPRDALLCAVRALASAYAHLPGYRPEWSDDA